MPGRARLCRGARGPRGRKGGGGGGRATAYGRGGDQSLVGGESVRAEVVGHERDLEGLRGHVLHNEISVGRDQRGVVMTSIRGGPAETNEHA